MPVDPNLLDLYGNFVDHQSHLGLDRNNEPILGAPANRQCKIVQEQIRVESDGEESRVSGTQIHFPEFVDVDARDIFTLPAPFSPTKPAIMKVKQHTGLDPATVLPEHTVVLL